MSARSLLRLLLISLVFTGTVRADDLPAGYEIGENSTSPDGRFAVLYPLRSAELPNGDFPPNLLVRLQPYAVINKVGRTGLPQGVTLDLHVEWHGNDLVAICEVGKWGLRDLWVYELNGDQRKRVHPVGDEARKIFEKDLRARLVKKYPDENLYFAWVNADAPDDKEPDFTFKGRKLLLDLLADNKPNLALGPHWTARLRATWNFDTGKFDKVDFRPGKITIRVEP